MASSKSPLPKPTPPSSSGQESNGEENLDMQFYKTFYADLKKLDDEGLIAHWLSLGKTEKRFPNFSELLLSKKIDPMDAENVDVDVDFYTFYYPNLAKSGINNKYKAKLHYLQNGKREGRFPNLLELLKSNNTHLIEFIDTFVDYDFYASEYDDLVSANIKNHIQAKVHYLIYGRQEDRLPNLKAWMDKKLFPSNLIPIDFSFSTILDLNKENGVEIKLKTFQELLSGRSAYPVKISPSASVNANFYFEMAKHYLTNHHREPAKNLLKTSLAFEKRGEFLELLGNIYLEENDHETASSHYEEAIEIEGISKWLFTNLANCKKMLSKPRQAIETLVTGIERNPEFSFAYDRLEEFVHEYWLKQQGGMEAFGVVNDRHALTIKTNDVASFIYKTYLRVYGVVKVPEFVGSCNLDRVLIVGDFHIKQCVRYRIDQKIEQLEAAGKTVTAISWTDLEREQNALAMHDVVIFYRVSAQPQVIKAIAQVNATGKLSIYEIDDLLFENIYPPPIETYGGYVDMNTYIGLTKGMALFNAAARLCRIGLASTELLAEKLQPLVFGKKCLVHRNGLDKLNTFKQPKLSQKPVVNIFYGSGTMAHNSDFSDLVLPSITQILMEFESVRLVVAGYLNLPSEFLAKFGNRIRQIPMITNMQAYWSLLEQADINLAVLHDDVINGCKSELKWFEASTLGIPTVMSTTANYRDVINNGVDGLIATTPEDWYNHLKTLVESPEKRFAMAQKAQDRAMSDYSVKTLSNNIKKVLEDAYKHSQPATPAKRKKIALVNVFFPPQSHGGATRVIADNFDLLLRDYGNKFELCVFTTD
ncbi:hypothetical protein JCM14076_11440 [Methylosoma difficile]